jgi:hypothetical protein
VKNSTPVVALTLGDAAGGGDRRLLSQPGTDAANIVLVGDPWLWLQGRATAGGGVAADLIWLKCAAAPAPAFQPLTPGRHQVQLGLARAARSWPCFQGAGPHGRGQARGGGRHLFCAAEQTDHEKNGGMRTNCHFAQASV